MSATMVRWLTGLAAVASITAIIALAWLRGPVEDNTPPSTRVLSAQDELPSAVAPRWRGNGPLSLAELRWCMAEEVRLDAIRPHLATRPAVDRYNRVTADFNDRCGGRKPSDEARERVTADITASRQAIEAGAIDEIQQLNDSVPVSIARIQELLSMLGYDPGVINGEYGSQTRAAIEAFQSQQRIPVDGLLSERLLDRLVRAFGQLRIRIELCRMRGLRDRGEQQSVDLRC